MNTPYVKKFDENGQLLNPINGMYVSGVGKRYRKNNDGRLFNNRNTFSVYLIGPYKYKRYTQVIKDVNGKITRIVHNVAWNSKTRKITNNK